MSINLRKFSFIIWRWGKLKKCAKSHRLQYLLQLIKFCYYKEYKFNLLIRNYLIFLFYFPKVNSPWSESIGIYNLEKVSRSYQERETENYFPTFPDLGQLGCYFNMVISILKRWFSVITNTLTVVIVRIFRKLKWNYYPLKDNSGCALKYYQKRQWYQHRHHGWWTVRSR